MFLYVVALILGIIYTVRKLDVRRREPEHFPHVDREAFSTWKRTELVAYNVASLACFAMVVGDLAVRFVVSKTAAPNWTLVRVLGFSIFAAWVTTVVWAMFRGNAGRRLRNDLGIDLRTPPPDEPSEGRSDPDET